MIVVADKDTNSLTVRDTAGKVSKRNVTFIISTAPKLTVSRKLF
jgi:hypothetical protein